MDKSEIIKCKDCKWWNDSFIGFPLCECPSINVIEKTIGWSDFVVNNFKNSSDAIVSYPTVDTGLHTGANFGCVHGELREENKDANN